MNHRTVKVGLLALAIVLPGAAFANEPAPGSTEGYSGSLAELATGVRSTPPQPTTIQSPRDAASGQAAGESQQGIMWTNDTIDKIPSARGSETAQSGQFLSGAGGDGQGIRREQPTQGNGALVNNENLTSARGTETAQPGQFVSGSGGDGTGIRKPRPNNRPRKGKRQHKP